MILGMTGSRNGFSLKAREKLHEILAENNVVEVHHGDCVGSDTQFHNEILKYPEIKIVIHPPNVDTLRGFNKSEYIKQCKPYLDRNKDIVNDCDILVAFPVSPETLRSGTWSTIRYAKKIGKKVVIIM